ncbi:hypothetical protein IGI04_026172 [Brassica rapa subsp. trilocularis]|uniref:NYN domain-containing protein n=1 Tax=Brassica rapa subsp. trilocularis TaxID=1813537 RepID=A0ABQ7KV82_BRACM|nr:hypothetical protein IGI04_026172 [Brassica rapa subsp. trilocularis]
MSDKTLPADPFPGIFAWVRIGIFWDVDQFKIDVQSDAHSAAQNIRKTLSAAGHLGKVEIMAYGVADGHDFKDKAKFTSFPAGADTERHTKMLQDILVWSSKSPNPSNLFLIMGDSTVDFSSDIESLVSSRHYKIHRVKP